MTWGDGVQTLLWAPYVCQACGGLSLVWLETGRLFAVSFANERYLETNAPALWEKVVQARAARAASPPTAREAPPCPT
jgi:hypothetical protein